MVLVKKMFFLLTVQAILAKKNLSELLEVSVSQTVEAKGSPNEVALFNISVKFTRSKTGSSTTKSCTAKSQNPNVIKSLEALMGNGQLKNKVQTNIETILKQSNNVDDNKQVDVQDEQQLLEWIRDHLKLDCKAPNLGKIEIKNTGNLNSRILV